MNGEVFAWRRGGGVAEVMHFTPERRDLGKPHPAKALATELQEFNDASAAWSEVCCIKFLSVSANDGYKVVAIAPETKFLASAGARHHQGKVATIGVFHDGVAEPPHRADAPRLSNRGEQLEVRLWFPIIAKKADGPRVTTPQERPSVGNISGAVQHKHAYLVSNKPANI